MKRSSKAVLLSAFVSPGAGHWFLKKKRSAVLFMLASSAAVAVLMSGAWTQANLIAEQILSEEGPMEMGALLGQMAQQSQADQSSAATIATVVWAMIWFAGILDAWRISLNTADPGQAPPENSKTR